MSKIELPSGKLLDVPCGKCIPCLQKKRNDWSFRLEQEHKVSKTSYFITLTYDQKHYPTDGCLNKKHVQDFLKRLRKRENTNIIRYFAVGEYGSETHRAHYHMLIFNVLNERNIQLSWSDSKGNPIGLVHVGKVTGASVAYTTKYIVQTDQVPLDKTKPFMLCSRKYGLGLNYLTDEIVDWHRADDRNYAMRNEQKCALPRIYRERIWPKITNKYRTDKITKEKVKIPLTNIQQYLNVELQNTRDRITNKSLKQSKIQTANELEYYKRKHGIHAAEKMAEARLAVIQSVKLKVKFTQHL